MTEEPQLTEEQIRQLQAQMDEITVDDVLLQTVVSLINLAGMRAGLAQPGTEPDWEQTRQAIEAVRALLPVVEPRHGQELAPIRQALSQLQIAYAQGTGAAAGGPGEQQGGEQGRDPEPPQRPGGGRLWVPGQ